jgi:adenylate cyclase
LLEDIFPHSIVRRLKEGEADIADNVEDATVLFCDIVGKKTILQLENLNFLGFSSMATTMSATQVVSILNKIFSRFDCLTATSGVEKIKTIGDAYMVGANISIPNKHHPEACVEMAASMIKVTRQVSKEIGKEITVR